MKRKTYIKKVRNFRYQLNVATECSCRDRPVVVRFPFTPPGGKYKGQTINSYQGCWDYLLDVLKGTDLADKV